MAHRRKSGRGGLNPRPSHTHEGLRSPPEADEPSSLAAMAIRASTARKDSSLSSAYEGPVFSNAQREPSSRSQDTTSFHYTSTKKLNESKYGFWDVFAQKAKIVLEEKHRSHQDGRTDRSRSNTNSREESTSSQPQRFYEGRRKIETPKIQKGLDAITSSLNYIGGRVGNALEEGISIVENRTADIIQETRKLNIRRKGSDFDIPKDQNHSAYSYGQYSIPPVQADQEIQLKAARDVANAMAAKAKLLMRELKTIKADLAFAKERCAQLEEENRILRESYEKGGHPEDDELIRLQLETLLAEKARLAHENSTYARENRFLREIVEYHQLTMQDVVYLDEGIEEVSEVYPTPSAHAGSAFSFQSTPVPWSSTSNAISLPVLMPPTPTAMSSSVQSVPKPSAATLSLST